MRFAFFWSATVACAVAVGTLGAGISQAVRLRDGKVYFVQPPSLGKVITTYKSIRTLGATYYFTINVPKDAGEPLQKVTISQYNVPDDIRFDLDDTIAYEGTYSDEGEKINLQDVTSDRETDTVTVIFDPPVSPGKTITIGLRPRYNPSIPGVYLFGVTAFPAGDNPHGQFLGYGRLQFYGGGDSSSFFRPW